MVLLTIYKEDANHIVHLAWMRTERFFSEIALTPALKGEKQGTEIGERGSFLRACERFGGTFLKEQ